VLKVLKVHLHQDLKELKGLKGRKETKELKVLKETQDLRELRVINMIYFGITIVLNYVVVLLTLNSRFGLKTHVVMLNAFI
jgi:hypothetical protein